MYISSIFIFPDTRLEIPTTLVWFLGHLNLATTRATKCSLHFFPHFLFEIGCWSWFQLMIIMLMYTLYILIFTDLCSDWVTLCVWAFVWVWRWMS